MSDKITIELDGRTCEATPGEMIIAVADREGVASQVRPSSSMVILSDI